MCGRFTSTTTDPDTLTDTFTLAEIRVEHLQPRYNVAPTQPILTIVADSDSQRFLGTMRWGLIPFWHKDPKRTGGHINARSETAAEKPTFRSAFRKRRCLIIADGFYEWQKNEDGNKTPMYIYLKDQQPFGMAGLWERWTHPETGEVWVTCAILTTSANQVLKPLHHRMPVILSSDDYGRWLDPTLEDADALQPLMQPYPDEALTYHPVSTRVNNVRNDDARLIERAS